MQKCRASLLNDRSSLIGFYVIGDNLLHTMYYIYSNILLYGIHYIYSNILSAQMCFNEPQLCNIVNCLGISTLPLFSIQYKHDIRVETSQLNILFQSIYGQKRVNLKQIAIVIMMAFLVSTTCLHYQEKVHRNPRGGTLSFVAIMISVRKLLPVTCWHSEM